MKDYKKLAKKRQLKRQLESNINLEDIVTMKLRQEELLHNNRHFIVKVKDWVKSGRNIYIKVLRFILVKVIVLVVTYVPLKFGYNITPEVIEFIQLLF